MPQLYKFGNGTFSVQANALVAKSSMSKILKCTESPYFLFQTLKLKYKILLSKFVNFCQKLILKKRAKCRYNAMYKHSSFTENRSLQFGYSKVFDVHCAASFKVLKAFALVRSEQSAYVSG